MSDGLRWSWCKNNKVHKCNALESSWNLPSPPCPWKNCLPWNQFLVSKKLGTTGKLRIHHLVIHFFFFLLHWCCHPIDWTLAEVFKVVVCVCWPSKFVQFVVRGQQTEIYTSKICLYLKNWSSDARSLGEQWHVCVAGEKLAGLAEHEWSTFGNNIWWPERG